MSLTNKSLPRFCQHSFNVKHQFASVQQLKACLQDTEVVVHVDYSENYNCKWSKEIQEAHFGGSHRQVALHTGVIYIQLTKWNPLHPYQSASGMMLGHT